MRSSLFLIDLILLSLAGLTGYLFWTTSPYQSTPATTSHFYDAFAQEVSSTQYNTDGHKRYEFQAPSVQHYEQNSLSIIQAPIFYMYTQAGEAWKISAVQAKATDGLSNIQLTDNVTVSGEQTAAFKDTRLCTEHAEYYPNEGVALTYHPVTMTQPNTRITADGMTAYFKENRLTLLSNVKGEHQLNSPFFFSSDRMDVDYLHHITTLSGHALAKTEKKGSITTATADIIKYHQDKHLAILLGNATVTDGMNTLNSPDIYYSIDQSKLNTEAKLGERVSIHIMPHTL